MSTFNALRASALASWVATMAVLLALTACAGVGIVTTADPYEKLAQAKHLESAGRISRARQVAADAAAEFEEKGDSKGLSEAYRQIAFLIQVYG